MLYCESCKLEYPLGKKFCRRCGKPLTKAAQADRNLPFPNATQFGRGLSLASAILFLLALPLPWIQVNSGQLRLEAPGYRVLSGTVRYSAQPLAQRIVQPFDVFRTVESDGRPGFWLFWLRYWWILLVMGLGAVLLPFNDDGPIFGALVSAWGLVVLYDWYRHTSQEPIVMSSQGLGPIHFTWQMGFWVAVSATTLAVAGAAIRFVETGHWTRWADWLKS